jgi:hypothetical protein
MGSTKRVAGLAGAPLYTSSKAKAAAFAPSAQAGENRNIHAMPGAAFNSGWYRPERLMSQSERLPS